MSRICVECGVEFIPYVTGHNLMCSECHTEFVNSVSQIQTETKDQLDKTQSKTTELTPEELIQFE
jgi:protein-arginine kinase activator protein McsA